MTTSLLDRVPVERISDRAAAARPGRTLLAVVAMVLFGAGWLAARVFTVAWRGLVWAGAAVAEGWESAHGPSRGAQIAALRAEVAALRASNSRLGG